MGPANVSFYDDSLEFGAQFACKVPRVAPPSILCLLIFQVLAALAEPVTLWKLFQ